MHGIRIRRLRSASTAGAPRPERPPGTLRDVKNRGAKAYGLATITDDGTVLDTWFPSPALTPLAENTDDALLEQSRGYGVGLGAWLTKVATMVSARR